MELLTPNWLSNKLGISESTLARYRCEGTGPVYIKVGRKILYPEAAVQGWLYENTYDSTSAEERGRCVFQNEWDELECSDGATH